MDTDKVLLAHFWNAIKTGRFERVPEEQIDLFIETICLEGEPLTPVSSNDREVIKRNLHCDLASRLNNDVLSEIAVNKVKFYKEGDEKSPAPWAPCFEVCPPPDKGIKPKIKIRLVSDPFIWGDGKIHYRNIITHLCYGGQRYLTNAHSKDNYGFSEKFFLEVVDKARASTGKERISMLDIYGNMGRALYEAKELSDCIETHNMGVHPEPARFKTDYLYLRPAEWMPLSFKERVDLIVSQILVWRYFAAPDIVMDNCVQALSVGGYAYLQADCCPDCVHVDRYNERVSNVSRWLKKLHKEKYIELEMRGELDKDAGGIVIMHKLKPTPEYGAK